MTTPKVLEAFTALYKPGFKQQLTLWQVSNMNALLGAEATADPEELRALEVAVHGAALGRSMERSRLMVYAAEARLAHTQERAATGTKAKVGWEYHIPLM